MIHKLAFRSTLILLLLSAFNSYAQNTVKITGEAIDGLFGTPVEAATVYLTNKKDSAVIDYSLTSADGRFKLEVKKINEPVVFVITDDLAGDYFQEFSSLTEDQDLGEVELIQVFDLEGIVITGAPPIRIKSDTLEFNASSFKVRPDANVETLLKQLPGVDIDEEGKITVNGKEVNKILVNGKVFFSEDGKIALENLPAELINKVQVTDTKTKKEELAGEKASGNNATINFTIDEDKNKGFMLKAMAGYGTDDRYESSMLFNTFKGDSRLSVLASSNNINSVGFSMNEIFDNMRGGRTRSTWSSSDGSFGINGMRFGSGTGITQSHLGGISYSDSFGKNVEFSGNYFYTQTDTKNNNHTRTENLLPNNIFTTESKSKTENQSFNHNFNTSFEVKIDSTSSIWIEPKYSYSKGRSFNDFEKFTVNELGELLNESDGRAFNESLNQNFSTDINYFKSFKNKHGLSLGLANNNSKNTSDETDISNTIFHQSNDPDEIRNQLTKNRTTTDSYLFTAEYTFPILDSVKLGVGARYELKENLSLKNAFDYNEDMGDYINPNDRLSFETSSNLNQTRPYLTFKIQKKKLYIDMSAGALIMNQKNEGFYMNDDYFLNQDIVSPYVSIYSNYSITDNSSFYLSYNYETEMPAAIQLLPIENLSNPLNIYTGNPNLKPMKYHSLFGGFNQFNMQSRSGFYMYFGGRYNDNDIVSYRVIDDNFVTRTTYENMKGNYSGWMGLNFNKSFSSGRNKYRLGGGLSYSHGYNQGFIDQVKYESRNNSMSVRANFNWDMGDWLTLTPSYNLSYQLTDYKNYRIDKSDNLRHVFNLATTSYWPKKIIFGNDFAYTYNSNIADGFKKDFLLWNTSLAYNFFKDQMTFKVKVYDVLGQNSSDRRSISATAISDITNDILTRYVMFSLSFKLDQFGGGEGGRRGGRSRMMMH